MKFNIEINTQKSNPNAVGELLRDSFWNQSDDRIGCYSSFDYNEDVESLPNERKTDDQYTLWSVAIWNNIICRWYWDGDGTIEFTFSDGSILINTDCKKNYTWEWQDTTNNMNNSNKDYNWHYIDYNNPIPPPENVPIFILAEEMDEDIFLGNYPIVRQSMFQYGADRGGTLGRLWKWRLLDFNPKEEAEEEFLSQEFTVVAWRLL